MAGGRSGGGARPKTTGSGGTLKYRWPRFVTWTKETIDAELADLLAGYGTEFKTNFS
ncbi:hypothetical protein BamMEX5DRAFT_0713 [Burkholderia ambifaria MEX-5]|uniref:Uncharacterized protein n=1 Tax=Burkholderia ambifaria MEX-5 TaxID=396597 RepID=B1SYU7_9BURK|nr:hypothetical protein BamMEX5DRAFT_0713 [Burkholderia ambifaria MEX-5]